MRKLFSACVALGALFAVAAQDSNEGEGMPKDSIAIDAFKAGDDQITFEMPDMETPGAHIDYAAEPATLTLITWGSSSCPEYPTSISWSNPTTLALASSTDYGDQPCTMDMSPFAHVVEVPQNQDGSEVESVVLNGTEIEFTTS